MQQRNLGNSGLKVSLVGLGCNTLGGQLDAAASRAIVHRALDLGITFFDTSDNYGNFGGSETSLGESLGARRKDVVVATKFASPMNKEGTLKGASRRYLMSAVEASLRRLNTDWIDLYQIHYPDPLTPIEETLRGLDDLVRQGKVRYIGCSNFPAWQVVRAHWTAKHHGLAPLVSCQDQYSLLAREPESDLIPAMQACGLGLLPYAPLCAGLLTGKYRQGQPMPAGARLDGRPDLARKYSNDTRLATVERLRVYCEQRGRSMIELALNWLAAQPVVASLMAGATSPAQLESNVAAIGWALGREDLAEIDRLCKGD